MPNALISILGAIAIVGAAAAVAAVLSKGRVAWGWLATGLVLMLAHDAALTDAWGWVDMPDYGNSWNWTGKALALLLALSVAALPALGWARSGITLAHDRRGLAPSLLVSALLVAVFLGLAFTFGGEGGSAEDFAFQLTLPGLQEEVFYRGVLLLVFNEAFGRPLRVLGAPMGWAAILTSLAFGLDHAFGYGDEGFSFDPMALALTGGPALLLVWLRERSGSLVLPIVLHNFANTIFMAV